MTLFEILEGHIIVAAHANLSMVAAWDGGNIIRFYQLWSATNLTDVDTYSDEEDLNIDSARAMAETYLIDVHRQQKAT